MAFSWLKSITGNGAFSATPCRLAAALFVMMPLSACLGRGVDDPLSLDQVKTGTISPRAAPALSTDEDAVARAVATADLTTRPEGPFPWANPDTGTTGVISSLQPAPGLAGDCRAFTTSLHRYDGIALFNGTTCRADSGEWRLSDFQPAS